MINEKLASVQLGNRRCCGYGRASQFIQYLQVEWDHENDRPADRRVDVATDVLVVEGDVAPSSGSRNPSTHFLIDL